MRIIDFHAHILPCVDHGSDGITTSLYQLELARQASVDTVFSTSHFYPHKHSLSLFLEKRNEAYRLLTEKKPDIDIRLGAEVLLCVGLERLEGLKELCLYGSDTILLELPFNEYSDRYTETVENMLAGGFDVVLAHADRYKEEIIDELISLGVTIQLNASSLSRLFKRKRLFDWIEAGVVVGLGSDIHMRDKNAYKHFLRAKSKIGKTAFTDIMQKSNLIFEKTKPYICE